MDNPAVSPNPNPPVMPAPMEDIPPPPPLPAESVSPPPPIIPPEMASSPPPPPPKKWGTGALVGAISAVFLIIASVVTGLTLYQRRNQPVAPTAPASRPQAVEPSPTPQTQTITVPKFTDQSCPWGQGDNLSPKGGQARARIEKSVSYNLSCPAASIESARITTAGAASFLYDDTLLILMDNKILGGFNTFFPPATLGDQWNWLTIRDVEQDSNQPTTKFICWLGSICSVPKSTLAGAVDIRLSQSDMAQVLSSPDTHTLTAIVTGDNNDRHDCKLQEDLTLTLTYAPGTNCGVTPQVQCQQVKVFRGGVEIQPADIKLGDTIIFRGFASVTNTTVSKIKFTLTKGRTAQAPVEENATLVGSLYQADYQIVIDQSTSYSVTAEAISP